MTEVLVRGRDGLAALDQLNQVQSQTGNGKKSAATERRGNRPEHQATKFALRFQQFAAQGDFTIELDGITAPRACRRFTPQWCWHGTQGRNVRRTARGTSGH